MASIGYWAATIGGITGASFGYIWAFAPLLLMVLVIAPVAIWKKDRKELEGLKQPILVVSVKPKPCNEETPFHHLEVKNPTGCGIKLCYGKVQRAYCIRSSQELPVQGIMLSWSTRHGYSGVLTTIAPDSSKFLDFVEIADYRFFHIPCEGLNRGAWYRFDENDYEVDIEVGSEDANFKPTRKTFRINYAGDYDLTISDITPRVADTGDSQT